MTLLQMSVSGAVMILVIVVIRALLLHKLPKKAFLFLWGVALVRLLIPYTLPCSFSAYSLLAGVGVTETAVNITAPPTTSPSAGNATLPSLTDIAPGNPAPFQPNLSTDSAPALEVPPENGLPFDIGTAVWIAGMAACAVFFAVSYIKCRIRFRESLPAESLRITEWLAKHKLRRRISVRQSDRIAAPLTYGVFRPVILLPKNYEKIDPDDLRFVLAHEYVHIRRFDTVFKLLLTAAVCVHWFNPLVWAMYVIANKDIEISCDEAVITTLGETEKKNYAMTLIRMEEIKSGLTPLISHYSKNSTKERIVTIMKFKKTTARTAAAAAFLAIGVTTAFATSPQPQNEGEKPQINSTDVSAPENSSAEKPVENIQESPVSPAEVQTNDVKTPVVATPAKTLKPTNAIKYTIDYYLEKYADYVTLTFPEEGNWFVLADHDENNKTLLYFIPLEVLSEDNTPENPDNYTHEEILDDGIMRW